jgi:predicted ATPase
MWQAQRTCYDSYYPFRVISPRGLTELKFEHITILYGNNGCGKSTALNVIAEKIELRRDSVFNKSSFYPDYLKMCETHKLDQIPEKSRIITSDDVFDYMLNIRNINEGIDQRREDIFKDYIDTKFSSYEFKSMEDYENLKKLNKTRRKTQSQFVRSELNNNIAEFSNGESAFKYFTGKIEENGLYILDEPENSLSPKKQVELKSFIEDSVRFFGCQFIISTHSPFLLALDGAKIYNLDNNPVTTDKWTQLPNVIIHREFFEARKNEFE